jgi:hypothetical protein
MYKNSYFLLCIFFCLTIFNAEASESSLDENYKFRILYNNGGYKLIVVDGDEIGSISDSKSRIDEGNFDFSFMFPDNYIGNTNFLYTFELNIGQFELTRQDLFYTQFEEGSMQANYNADLGTNVSGEWYLFTPTLAYNFFKDSYFNIRTGFGLGFGRARYAGDIYLTDNKHLENTLSSSCWDYVHSNKTFEDISNFCSKKSIDSDYSNYGGHYFLDIRTKYIGYILEFYVLTNNREGHLSRIAEENLNKAIQGLYILIPL